jgi:hypothetical protein
MKTVKEQRDTLGRKILNTILQQDRKNHNRQMTTLTKDKNEKILAAIAAGRFHDAFVPLKILRDQERHIKTTYQQMSTDGKNHPVLIRDARYQYYDKAQTGEHAKYDMASCYKYAQLGLNLLSGLMDLLELTSADGINDADKSQLIEIAKAFYERIKKTGEDQVEQEFSKLYYDFLVPYYRKRTPGKTKDDAIEDLRLARDFANMKHEPYAVATISAHPVTKPFISDKTYNADVLDVLEVELPMVELTDSLKQQYQHQKLGNQEWFKHQSDLAQIFIREYAPKILEGAMIPAQLIYHLVGSRNAYEKWTIPLAEYIDSDPIWHSAYHAGSQAHLLRLSRNSANIRQTATNDTIEQLEMLTDASSIVINSLVSPKNPYSNDPCIWHQLTTAQKEISKKINAPANEDTDKASQDSGISISGISVANSPINITRLISSPDHDAFKSLVEKANTLIKAQPASTHTLFKHVHSQLEQSLDTRQTVMDTENDNLTISAQSNLLAHELNKHSEEQYALFSGCLSGQDRGGLVSTHTSNLAILNYLSLDKKHSQSEINAQLEAIIFTQAIAGHTAEMTGNAGTGFGGEGIKTGSKGALPTSYQHGQPNLIATTGKLNEHAPKSPPSYFWLKVLVGMTIVGLIFIAFLAWRSKKNSVSPYADRPINSQHKNKPAFKSHWGKPNPTNANHGSQPDRPRVLRKGRHTEQHNTRPLNP